VPVHSAVPTAPVSHGWLTGRGESSARPFPAHSSVTGTVTRGRARNSSIVRHIEVLTAPSTSTCHVDASTAGRS
jgi:hypothetical protein